MEQPADFTSLDILQELQERLSQELLPLVRRAARLFAPRARLTRWAGRASRR